MRLRRRELLLLVLFIILVTLSVAQACWCKCCCCKRRHRIRLRQKHLYPTTKRFSKLGSPAQQMLKASFLPKEGEIVKRPLSKAVTKIHPLGHHPVFLRPHARRVTKICRPLTEGSPAQRTLAARFPPKPLVEKKASGLKPSSSAASTKRKDEKASPATSLTSAQDEIMGTDSDYSEYSRRIIVIKPPVSPSGSKSAIMSLSSSKSSTVSQSGRSLVVPVNHIPNLIVIKESACEENDKQRAGKSGSASKIRAGSRQTLLSDSQTKAGVISKPSSHQLTVRVPLEPKLKSEPVLR